jgi:hypothetical protein
LFFPQTMKYYKFTLLGLLLLVVGLVLLVTAPKEFSLVQFIAGLTCLVLGALLTAGFLGTDPVAARMRDEAEQRPTRARLDTRDIPEGTFPYYTGTWPQRLANVMLVALALGLMGAACAIWALLGTPFGEGGEPLPTYWRPVFASPFYILGLFCLWCSRRLPHTYVRIDPEGIEAMLLFKTVKIKWDEIVSLTARQIIMDGQPTTKVFYVYSQDHKLYFTDRLKGCDELIALLPRVTRRQWQ